jgi:tetratricopeptide (TPR) repeat protein
VIEMEEAPVEQRATALFNRGVTYSQLGESEKAIADYSAVIEMEEAPVDERAGAQLIRGARYWHTQRFGPSLNDFTAVAEMTGVSSSTMTAALFRIPEAMIPIKSVNESVESIRRAFAEGDPETNDYGGTPRDILRMVMGREPRSWAEFIEALVPIYAQYEALSTLASGLTESIAALDSGGYSDSQLDLWNSSWQRCGAEHDELSIALSALNAAVQVIKTRSDRPLFALPSEIRGIVRPLLKHSLSTE